MKWETHGQKQTMEDTRKGKQAKESATTAEADWWLKTDELGDRYLNPEKDGKRNMMGNKWMQRKDIRTAGHHQTSRARLGDKQRETSEDRHPETGSHWPEWETRDTRGTEAGKEKHPESRTQWTQLCKPKAVTVSNSNLRDPIGRQLEEGTGDSICWWQTTGRCGGWMESKTTGKESGKHIWNKIRANWKTTFERQTRDH